MTDDTWRKLASDAVDTLTAYLRGNSWEWTQGKLVEFNNRGNALVAVDEAMNRRGVSDDNHSRVGSMNELERKRRSKKRKPADDARPETREVKPYCTCEGPFGCVIHDQLPPDFSSFVNCDHDAIVEVLRKADAVLKRLQNADGEVYLIDCDVANELEGAMRAMVQSGAWANRK